MEDKEVKTMNFVERTVEKHGEDIDQLKNDVSTLQGTVKNHDQSINQINKVLDAIQDDTRFLRRTLIKGFITAGISAGFSIAVGLTIYFLTN